MTLEKEVKDKVDIFAINNDSEETKKETKAKKTRKSPEGKDKSKVDIYMK